MKNYLYLLLGAMCISVLSGCAEDDNLNSFAPHKGKVISFGLSAKHTRTVYGDEYVNENGDRSWPLYWVENDPITIYCAEAEEAKSANYTVIPTSATSNSNTGTITENGSEPLKWGGDTDTHNFYAVYPNNIVVKDGIATFPINRNQTAKVTSTDGYSQNVVATPDMSNAYMVAKMSTKPTDQSVNLEFKPIMTTLDIEITGAPGGQNSADAARITGISISSTITTNSNASKDNFYYDINKGIITAGSATSSDKATTQTENTFINLVDNDGKASYVDLANGHTLTITAFLPPMSKEVAANLKRQVKVRVHATGNKELVASIKTNESSDSWTTQLTPSAKRKIQLPTIPTSTNETGNNWITALDGDIYVSQMSIPGAHDAATGEEMQTGLGTLFASTQEQTLQTQWNLGVRAFDLRPAIYDAIIGSTNELWLYHGVARVTVSWAKAMETITTNLTDNPGEFVIVLFRHEDEGCLGKNTNTTDFNNYMTNWINANSSWIVDWKPDLTIDECRGKIILISRFSGSWNYGCFTGWNHEATGATTTLNNADGKKSATMYVQDYYNPSSHEAKWAAIQTYLDITKTFHTDPTKVNHWAINHASGYVGSSSSDTYQQNAAAQNPNLISYITSDSWEGSTGIILFDYVGASKSNGLFSGDTEVYGDIALQTIIDNNYKYRMKRRGE